jgi:hypothetical protein
MMRIFVGLLAVLALASCESPAPTSARATDGASRFAQAPPDRPGLGTRWGEDRTSRVDVVGFERADPNHPAATAAIFYNDAAGIRAMTTVASERRPWLPLTANGGRISARFSLKNEHGRFLPGVVAGGRWFVVGQAGERYTISLKNNANARVEAVLSVDGLDVIDGGKASLRKHGYIVMPHQQLEVEGFRQSREKVAAFRFSPVRESYANEKYHDTRNVGVVGVALFDEREPINPQLEEEAKRRLNATPFQIPARPESHH